MSEYIIPGWAWVILIAVLGYGFQALKTVILKYAQKMDAKIEQHDETLKDHGQRLGVVETQIIYLEKQG